MICTLNWNDSFKHFQTFPKIHEKFPEKGQKFQSMVKIPKSESTDYERNTSKKEQSWNDNKMATA